MRTLSRTWRLLSVASAAVVLCLAVFVYAADPPAVVKPADEKAPAEAAPKTVLDAVKARYPNAEVTSTSRETKDGRTVYSVTIKDRGQTMGVTVTAEGAITSVGRHIDLKALPQAISQALEARYPKATHKTAEEVIVSEQVMVRGVLPRRRGVRIQERLSHYAVRLVTADNQEVDVHVALDGRIIKEEKKSAEK